VLRHVREKNLIEAADSNHAGTAATLFKQALETLRNEIVVGDVRGIGLLWAVEFVADKAVKRPFAPAANFAGRVAAAALKRGLLVYPMQGCVNGISGDHLLLAPPAVITPSQIAWSIEQLAAAIREAQTSLL
jgi:adenosylmethionine-8-amino-7-oxononanoate aminotransferase